MKNQQLVATFDKSATVNEIIETLQVLKEKGEITGEEKIVKECDEFIFSIHKMCISNGYFNEKVIEIL